jgi:hypothetical protein
VERRGFLKGILALSIAPAVITTPGLLMPVRSIITPLRCEPKILGFGLAMAKAEGSILEYDLSAMAIWPSVREFWSKAYEEGPCIFDQETGLYLPK